MHLVAVLTTLGAYGGQSNGVEAGLGVGVIGGKIAVGAAVAHVPQVVAGIFGAVDEDGAFTGQVDDFGHHVEQGGGVLVNVNLHFAGLGSAAGIGGGELYLVGAGCLVGVGGRGFVRHAAVAKFPQVAVCPLGVVAEVHRERSEERRVGRDAS